VSAPDPDDAANEVTRLLAAVRAGEPAAMDQVFGLVYGQLRALARRQRRRGPHGATLGTTALVHEAYLKLAHREGLALQDRAHFFALAARAMRQILVDYARERQTLKRGGGVPALPFDDERPAAGGEALDVLSLDDALSKLGRLDDRLVRLVELRFFAGLSIEETAELLGVSERTAKRDWQRARAFLHHELADATA
jgi:RNA polymerase sigma factor (TIGR02999 family)